MVVVFCTGFLLSLPWLTKQPASLWAPEQDEARAGALKQLSTSVYWLMCFIIFLFRYNWHKTYYSQVCNIMV